MKKIILVLFIAAFAFADEATDELASKNLATEIMDPQQETYGVTELNHTTFYDAVDGVHFAAILFYGKNCLYCQTFAVTYILFNLCIIYSWKELAETVMEEPMLHKRVWVYFYAF